MSDAITQADIENASRRLSMFSRTPQQLESLLHYYALDFTDYGRAITAAASSMLKMKRRAGVRS